MPENSKPHHTRKGRKRLPAPLYASPNTIWFVTTRAYLFQTPFIKKQINRMVIDILHETGTTYFCNIYVYCLMPDHLHLLLSTKKEGHSVLKFIERFKGKTTNKSWTVGWRGALWQPGFYDRALRQEDDLRKIAQYILENPVRKGLSKSPQDWPWSGMITPWPI